MLPHHHYQMEEEHCKLEILLLIKFTKIKILDICIFNHYNIAVKSIKLFK